MPYVIAYVMSIVVVNYGFVHVPLVDLGDWGMWPPMSVAVGAVFVLRDYAQRAIGHWVLAAMLTGVCLSYFMASPFVALASATAFAVSECLDWVVYNLAKRRSFGTRVLWSSVVSTPADSAVFLAMIGHFSLVAVLLMTISKMLAALVVWRSVHHRV